MELFILNEIITYFFKEFNPFLLVFHKIGKVHKKDLALLSKLTTPACIKMNRDLYCKKRKEAV